MFLRITREIGRRLWHSVTHDLAPLLMAVVILVAVVAIPMFASASILMLTTEMNLDTASRASAILLLIVMLLFLIAKSIQGGVIEIKEIVKEAKEEMAEELSAGRPEFDTPSLGVFNVGATYKSIEDGLKTLQSAAAERALEPPALAQRLDQALWDYIHLFGLEKEDVR